MLDTSGKMDGQNPCDLKFQIAFPPGNEAAARNILRVRAAQHESLDCLRMFLCQMRWWMS